MGHIPCLRSFRKELEFVASIASCIGRVDAPLLKEQLIGEGSPATIFAHARDAGATEDDMRYFLLSLRDMRAGREPLLTLDAVKYLQSELWQVNTVRRPASRLASKAIIYAICRFDERQVNSSLLAMIDSLNACVPIAIRCTA
jgi:hypothetical protein